MNSWLKKYIFILNASCGKRLSIQNRRFWIDFTGVILTIPQFLLASAQSPPVPPAGVVDRQIEQEYEVKEVDPTKEIPLLEFDLPHDELDIGGETLQIQGVEIIGNRVLKTKILISLLTSYLNRTLSMKELKEMCRLIQAKYGQEGYFLTRAYLPPQEIRNGILQIEVIEGKLGKVEVVGNRFYKTTFISRYFDKFLGKPIHYDQILKALFLLDEHSDLKVGAVFKKGERFGEADLILKVVDARPIHLTLDTNNYGSDHTTHQRTGTRLDYSNLAINGDQLTLIEVLGSPISHLNFTDVIYHLPITTYGTSMDISYLCANFKTDRVDEIRYVGKSHIGGIKVNQPFHRTRRLNTDAYASFDLKQIQNFGAGQRTSFDKLRVVTGGVSIDYIDGWKGRNLFYFSAGWGIPGIFGGLSARSSESSRQGSGGQFIKMNGGWKRVQQLPYDCFVLINSGFQLGLDKLPLPEEIYIGGIDTVRGYPLAEGLGDSGYYGTVELHVPPPILKWGRFLQFVGFVDLGQTFVIGGEVLRELSRSSQGRIKHKTHFDQRVMLLSAGPGVRVHGPWKLEWSFDVGFPVTERHRSSKTITYFRVAWKCL